MPMTMRKACATILVGAAVFVLTRARTVADEPVGLPGQTVSSPIALSPDDGFVWVVNPENNSVSLIEVAGDVNTVASLWWPWLAAQAFHRSRSRKLP